jgi:hypothetical protein
VRTASAPSFKRIGSAINPATPSINQRRSALIQAISSRIKSHALIQTIWPPTLKRALIQGFRPPRARPRPHSSNQADRTLLRPHSSRSGRTPSTPTFKTQVSGRLTDLCSASFKRICLRKSPQALPRKIAFSFDPGPGLSWVQDWGGDEFAVLHSGCWSCWVIWTIRVVWGCLGFCWFFGCGSGWVVFGLATGLRFEIRECEFGATSSGSSGC